MLRIRTAQPLEPMKVRLTLTDGSIVERDLWPLVQGPAFAALRDDPRLFRQVGVDHGTLVWPNGLDLCPDIVIHRGLVPVT